MYDYSNNIITTHSYNTNKLVIVYRYSWVDGEYKSF